MKKNNYINNKNEKNDMSIVPMNYITGTSGLSQRHSSSKVNSDIYIFKIPVSNLETGYSPVIPPEEFELFNVSYSANEIDNPVSRTMYAVYTFTRIKKIKRVEI